MELNKIEIKNFRSIKLADVIFDHKCLILLGKNEAGKSNVLKAIAAIFGKYTITDKDKRKKIDNERILETERYIRAIISLTPEDIKTVYDRFISKYTGIEYIGFISKIKLDEYIQKVFNSFFIHLQIGSGQNTNFDYTKPDDIGLNFRQKLFIDDNKISTSGDVALDLNTLIFEIIYQLYTEKPFKCHFWQYQDNYLLPGRVNIADFIGNPSSCQPLEHIFQLCGRENILQEFSNSLEEDGDYSNLLDQVSKKVTETFQGIWKDMEKTVIQFIPNGNEILIKLSDKAKYNFEDRSDGFKKFISILLMLSTQARANKIIDNDIILIDEPDQSLYPSSARFLRDELLSISRNSKVIYSTHSQYMIDSNSINRHYLVEKQNDVTTLKRPDGHAPYSQDELLRNAIGSSIFEIISEKNIVFEGFLDKQLFDKYIMDKGYQEKFKNIGRIFLWGISGVEAVTSILQSGNRKFIVVADSDKASKDKRLDFEANNPQLNTNWLAYGEVVSTITTMEDFFTESFLLTTINKFVPGFSLVPNKPAITNIGNSVDNDKLKKQEIKNALILNCTSEVVKVEYDQFVATLLDRINSL